MADQPENAILNHRRRVIRLFDKVGIRRLILLSGPSLPRYDKNLYGWPAIAHRMGQLQPVHASGHVDVREHQSNVCTGFQKGHSFVSLKCYCLLPRRAPSAMSELL